MVHFTYLTVLDVGSVNDAGAKRGPNALMTKAYSQDGDVDFSDEFGVEPKISLSFRSARSGRQNDCIQRRKYFRREVLPTVIVS